MSVAAKLFSDFGAPVLDEYFGFRVFCFTEDRPSLYKIATARIGSAVKKVELSAKDNNLFPRAVEEIPVLIFSADDKYQPAIDDICVVDKTRGYKINKVSQAKDNLITANATRLSPQQFADYEFPKVS